MTELRFGSATDVGLVRANNQDRFLVAEPLFAVADGMGGHAAGEVASATAVTALNEAFTERTPEGLAAASRAANRAVWDQAQADAELRGMGTTLVALALVGDAGSEELAVTNIGDSRLYLLRLGELVQVTTDHSLVGELVAEGSITAAEAEIHPRRHVLTRALGVDADVPVDLLTVELHQGDRFLLCSDGLSREVTDDQAAAVLRRLADPAEAARELVRLAKEHGGNDNVTVVVVDVADDGGKAAPMPLVPAAEASVKVPGTWGKGVDEPTTALHIGAVAEHTEGERTESERPDGWWARRQARRRAAPTTNLITPRVIGFFALFVVLVAIACGGVAYYARESYFVGLQGPRLVIFQGRPGGVLWFKPTVADRPDVTTKGILAVHLSELRSGKVEGSLVDARQYVANIHREYLAARAANTPKPSPMTTTPTTTTTTTTEPTTLPATTITSPTITSPAIPVTTVPALTTPTAPTDTTPIPPTTAAP